MDNMPNYNKMLPEKAAPIAGYPTDALKEMYPDTYNVIYPKVQKLCMEMDTPDNPEMCPCPSRQTVERMTDQIYSQAAAEMGFAEDAGVTAAGSRQPLPYGAFPVYGGYFSSPGYVYGPGFGYGPGYGYGPGFGYGPGIGLFGGRRLLRDLTGILLIRELLGRRGVYY